MDNNLGNKETMARNIQYYMNLKNVSRNDLCKALDVPYTTLRDWLKAITYPRIDKIEMMANYFNISKADLVEDHSSRSHLTQCQTKDEETLVLSYRELNDINKKKVSHTQTISYQLNVWKTNSAPLTPALI